MLREIVCKHIKPRLIPFRVTQGSSSATMSTGYGDLTVAKTATGKGTITLRNPFSRSAGFFGTAGVGDGGFASLDSVTGTRLTIPYFMGDNSAIDTNGDFEGFCFGFDSTDTNVTKDQRVACSRPYSRLIWGKITGSSGAVAIGGNDFSVTRNSTGIYTITFKKAFAQIPVVAISPISTTTCASSKIETNYTLRKSDSIKISLSNGPSGSLTDFDFYIVVVGQDTKSDSGKNLAPLTNSQRKPRILFGQVTVASGVPTLSAGAGDFSTTITDNGTGDFSLTISNPFKREPAVLVMTTTQRVQVHSASASAVRFLTKGGASGNNADLDGVTSIFVIGSDDATQY